jgi:hypothetical protein
MPKSTNSLVNSILKFDFYGNEHINTLDNLSEWSFYSGQRWSRSLVFPLKSGVQKLQKLQTKTKFLLTLVALH